MSPFSNDEHSSTTMPLNKELSSSSSHQTNTTDVHRVTFAVEPEFHFIETLDEIDDDMFFDLWFDDDEMRAMIARAAKVMDGTNRDDSPRGLENNTFQGGQRRRQERSKASAAVLGEQLRQKAAKTCEDTEFADGVELISREYHKVSSRQQELAYQRAQQDVAAASENGFRRSLSAVKNWFSKRDLMQEPIA